MIGGAPTRSPGSDHDRYDRVMEPTADVLVADEALAPTDDAPETLVEEELLVEEISIDGMCGVY